ncbi:SWIM zinc finger family protein [Amycolatopsis saalfeldensis]|uniref:SWIM zinc finger family protein n=1 Tax=Amycolatopsis saalfeldensis TaxID=394193 RepID=UPI002481D0BF|nr:SWIM zinc finger family protein [Amycolatopsis saalfeldensis]
MAARWSTERVLGLAPDASSAKAGRGQAVPARWSGAGASARAVWGACQGSGQKPYQAAVELAGPAFRCTCPSRKFPCKHALGLLLLWSSGQVPETPDEPGWVRIWLEERASRDARAEKRPEAPKDLEAAAKRAQDRMARVTAGAAELRGWLTDRVEAGFAGFERGGAGELRGVAARMIDAQATGLANGLRRAAGLVGRGRDWPGDLLAELSLLYVLAGSVTRLEQLPPDLAETIRTRLGFATSTAQVLESGERVADQWLVTGAVDEELDALRTRRTWLRGRHSGRPALVLSFAPPGRPLDSSLPPGHIVPGELAFYPGAVPLRALFADHTEPVTSPPPRGDTVAEALSSYAEALAADPWLDRWPMLLADVTPARYPGPGTGPVVPSTGPTGLPISPTGSATNPTGLPTSPTSNATNPTGPVVPSTGPAGRAAGPTGNATNPTGLPTGTTGRATGLAGPSTGPTGNATNPTGLPTGSATAPAGPPTGPARPTTDSAGHPTTGRTGWALSDVDGSALPLTPGTDPWRLLALAAAHPVTLAAEWTPAGLRPLTCWHPDGVVRLD